MNNKVAKKILNICLDVVIAIIVILAVIISITTLTARSNDEAPNLFGYSPFSVQTDSMKDTINPGDYIIVKRLSSEDAKKLDVDDIISFYEIKNGTRIINTHRILNVIKEEDGTVKYETKGDNAPAPDENKVKSSEVVGIYNGTRIPMFGNVMDFLSSTWGFFFVILVPVLLFTIFQIYKLIAAIMHNKKVAMMEEVADSTSDDVKEAIIAEYLAKQQEEQNSESEQKTEEETDIEDKSDKSE